MEEIKTYIEKAEQSIMFRENYDQFFDLTALADWYIINEIAKNNDALFNSSVYLNFKLGEQIQMGPVWDYDISFGNINYNGNDSIQGFFIKKAAYFEQLFKQTDFVYFYHDYKLISKVQIITPKGDFGIRENYSYFKQSYWLNDIDTILLNDLGDLSKKEKNQIVYDVYQNCDSTVNTIRNRSAHHTSLLKIHELAAQAIGHENRTFSQFNNQKENKLQDIHTFCSDQFNTMIQELEIKQKNKIEEIKKSKSTFTTIWQQTNQRLTAVQLQISCCRSTPVKLTLKALNLYY